MKATPIIHRARMMLPGTIAVDDVSAVCGPSQLRVARPKASAPHASDQGPTRQPASPSPSCPAATDMSISRPQQNAASAIAPHRIWSSADIADIAVMTSVAATLTRSRPTIRNCAPAGRVIAPGTGASRSLVTTGKPPGRVQSSRSTASAAYRSGAKRARAQAAPRAPMSASRAGWLSSSSRTWPRAATLSSLGVAPVTPSR